MLQIAPFTFMILISRSSQRFKATKAIKVPLRTSLVLRYCHVIRKVLVWKCGLEFSINEGVATLSAIAFLKLLVKSYGLQ